LELADLVGTPDRSSAFTAEQQRQRAQSKLVRMSTEGVAARRPGPAD
jgi:hypothetical protein